MCLDPSRTSVSLRPFRCWRSGFVFGVRRGVISLTTAVPREVAFLFNGGFVYFSLSGEIVAVHALATEPVRPRHAECDRRASALRQSRPSPPLAGTYQFGSHHALTPAVVAALSARKPMAWQPVTMRTMRAGGAS